MEIVQRPTDFDLRMMKEGLGALYTWGAITYDDAFGFHHFTKFRNKIVLRKDGIYEFDVDSQGNEAD